MTGPERDLAALSLQAALVGRLLTDAKYRLERTHAVDRQVGRELLLQAAREAAELELELREAVEELSHSRKG